MAAFLWGSTQLNVVRGSYKPPRAVAEYTQTKLLPKRDDLAALNTVVQQKGRDRYVTSFEITCYSYAAYQSLLDDHLAGTERVFVGADGYSETMFIWDLGEPAHKLYPLRYECSITLMEV